MNKYSTLADIKEEFKVVLHILENYEDQYSHWKSSGVIFKVFNISEGRYLQHNIHVLRIKKLYLSAYFKIYYKRTELQSLENFNQDFIKAMRL